MIARFENPEHRDVQELFNKLKQVITVANYEDRFEELRAQVVHRNKGLDEDYFVSSFLSGLKEHIKASVQMFRPQTLCDAVFLAKQEQFKSIKPAFTTGAKATNTGFSNVSTMPFSKNFLGSASFPTVRTASNMPKQGKSVLSSKEILDRRAKGLCFHCDDKYHPGQECKARLYQLEGEEIDNAVETEMMGIVQEMQSLLVEEESPGEISINALAGSKSLSTIRLQGSPKQ